MANSITLASRNLPLMDEAYALASLTMPIEIPTSDMRVTQDAASILVQKMTLDGLSDYSRNSGYTAADCDIAWSTFTMSKDRGARFNIDILDVNEAMISIAKVQGEFIRTKVVPEVDQYRFKILYDNAGTKTQSTTPAVDSIIDDIDTAILTLADASVDLSNCVLYVSNTVYNLMKQSSDVTRMFSVNSGTQNFNRNIEYFDGIQVVRVPSTRFSSGATFGSGSYTQTGYKLNFVLVDKNAVFAVKKHVAPKIITPEVNQTYDGYSVYYRIYHDCFAYENKTAGVYVNYGLGV